METYHWEPAGWNAIPPVSPENTQKHTIHSVTFWCFFFVFFGTRHARDKGLPCRRLGVNFYPQKLKGW